MKRNDNLFKTVIDKNKELRNKISKLALRILKYYPNDVEKDAKNNGYKTMKDLANEIFLGKKTLSSLKVKSTFTLSPPKGGFLRSTRRMYTQGGILGKNPQLNDIVLKMI